MMQEVTIITASASTKRLRVSAAFLASPSAVSESRSRAAASRPLSSPAWASSAVSSVSSSAAERVVLMEESKAV